MGPLCPCKEAPSWKELAAKDVYKRQVNDVVTQLFLVGHPLVQMGDGHFQCLVLAAFRPEDLLFHHRHIDHMKMVVVDLPA